MISFLFSFSCFAQDSQINASSGDGMAIFGYIDNGAYINFTGPNINYKSGNSKFVVGMLPSLRFKGDDGQTKNSFITPNLGVGVTYSYKYFAFQIPFYYNAKTALENGKWNVGVGIGVNIEYFYRREKK